MGDEFDEMNDDYLWDMENGFIDDGDHDLDDEDMIDHEIILGLDEYEISELEESGIDIDEFELMDEYERREALVEAGLNPDDYEFF